MESIMSKNAYLKAMDIDVWVERNAPKVDVQNGNIEKSDVNISEVNAIPEVTKTAPVMEVTPTAPEKIDIKSLDWNELHTQVSKCQLCDLSQTRTQTIFGEGNKKAELMIIADDSNVQSAKLLTAMLKAIGYQRNDIYITNIIKCNIEENKEASEEQTESCEPYLLRQISLVQPKIILALGNTAAQRLLKSKSTMNRLRGQLHYVDGINAPILVTYHPTYLIAAPNEKRKAWEDLKLAIKELAE